MNAFSKALVALMVVSMVVASGSAFAGEKKHHKKHKKHAAQIEQKKTEKAGKKKAEEAKPAAAPAEKLPE